MKDSLTKKIREVEDEHFADAERSRLDAFDEDFTAEAHRFHGSLQTVTSFARSLTSKHIQGLMVVEEKKYYLAWGYERFVDYLNSDEVPDLSKTKYYELKALLKSEGPELFDVYSGRRVIPVATRKLLAERGVPIGYEEGDLIVGDKRIPTAEDGAMKEFVVAVHDVLRERDDRDEKKDAKIAQLEARNKQGEAENEQLLRRLDSIQSGDPYDNTLMRAINGLLLLREKIGDLPDAVKAKKGEIAMPQLWTLYLALRDSYGTKFNFEDAPTTHTRSELDEIAAQVLDGADDLD